MSSEIIQQNNNLPLEPLLTWRVHLLRRQPQRLPTLALVLLIGALCTWLLFGRLLPACAAILVLLGSAAEYLLPTTYQLTPEGVTARSPLGRLTLTWRDAKRCLLDPAGLIVTPLPVASRLDRFRGVLLRFAPMGEPGDRASLCAAITRYAPDLNLLDSLASLDSMAGSEFAGSEFDGGRP